MGVGRGGEGRGGVGYEVRGVGCGVGVGWGDFGGWMRPLRTCALGWGGVPGAQVVATIKATPTPARSCDT